MLVLFGILIMISSVILGFIVLVQNPKGGGLSGTFGGVGNQLMGVRQTTNALEKGTWLFAGIVGFLCLISPAFIPNGDAGSGNDLLQNVETRVPGKQVTPPATTPATTVPMPGTTTAPDSK